jgi:hypothetical protein
MMTMESEQLSQAGSSVAASWASAGAAMGRSASAAEPRK